MKSKRISSDDAYVKWKAITKGVYTINIMHNTRSKDMKVEICDSNGVQTFDLAKPSENSYDGVRNNIYA